MRINAAFIGAGNVATHLAPALENIGVVITHIYNRTPKEGVNLVKKLYQAELKSDLDFSSSDVDIIFITVADDALQEVISELSVHEDTIVVHTSGAQPIDILAYHFPIYGVFYPLQTFSKSKQVNFKDIPLLTEGSDKKTIALISSLGKRLTGNVKEVSSEERAYVHLAAVFACNFSNHMIRVAEELLRQHKLDIKILLPLISETMNKALNMGAEQAQTGPARRHDLKTLDKHVVMLQKNEDIAEIYKLISQHILNSYS
jgi:predicted short-subunit dehydrogenase-like oxidoreductase (DUF2520 family)